MNLCEITKQLWEDYLIVRTPESLTRAMNRLAPDCVLIGTGKHEFYLSRERMQQALEVEVEQTRGCRFYIVDEWCQELPLTEDVRLVYGGLRVRDAELGKPALVDMDSRYTLVYTRQGEDWVVRHGHQSLPYTEQAAGESYPRTLIEQVKEARHLADRMTRLAQKDPVTGLYNHRGFFDEANVRLAEGPGCFMVLDLDDFKQINDTYGHITGDDILRQTGDVLRSATRSVDVVGRIGGDEYAIFCPGVTQEAVALAIARRIYDRHRKLTAFFVALGVDPEVAAHDACKIEHDLSEETYSKMIAFAERQTAQDETQQQEKGGPGCRPFAVLPARDAVQETKLQTVFFLFYL